MAAGGAGAPPSGILDDGILDDAGRSLHGARLQGGHVGAVLAALGAGDRGLLVVRLSGGVHTLDVGRRCATGVVEGKASRKPTHTAPYGHGVFRRHRPRLRGQAR